MIGLPLYIRAIVGGVVSHWIQVRLREMGLHQPKCMLYGILGSSPDEGLQSAAGCLQPLRQALGRRHALGLERPKQRLQWPAQAIQCRPALCYLLLCFCKKAPGFVSSS